MDFLETFLLKTTKIRKRDSLAIPPENYDDVEIRRAATDRPLCTHSDAFGVKST